MVYVPLLLADPHLFAMVTAQQALSEAAESYIWLRSPSLSARQCHVPLASSVHKLMTTKAVRTVVLGNV